MLGCYDSAFFLKQNMEEQPEFDDLVTIARFSFPYQAHLLAGRLESEGIQAFVQDELQLQISPWMDNTLGGVRVQVKTSDEIAAHEVMKNIQDAVTPDIELHAALDIDGKIYDLVNGICPECGKAAVYLARSGNVAATGAVAFVLAFGIPIKLEHKYFCYSCHYEWNG